MYICICVCVCICVRIYVHAQVILFSCVRCNDARRIGFLSDARRLNVAITRARRGLILVGDDVTLGTDPTWRAYLGSLRRNGCMLGSLDELLPEPPV